MNRSIDDIKTRSRKPVAFSIRTIEIVLETNKLDFHETGQVRQRKCSLNLQSLLVHIKYRPSFTIKKTLNK